MKISEFRRRVAVRFKRRAAFTSLRWIARSGVGQSRHGLEHPLVVSLTSYAGRFATLHLTLKCLLTQSLKPDRVVLWLAREDLATLPVAVTALREHGLDIREHRDLRSYNKIIPSLTAFPDAVVVTADDDVYYDRHWLRVLVQSWNGKPDQIVCRRAHQVMLDSEGNIASYRDWRHDIRSSDDPRVIFPTGVGGVLYPPGSLSTDVVDEARFMALAPYADDLWLYWMGRRAGSRYKIASKPWTLVVWPTSQTTNLATRNWLHGGNDEQIANLVRAYGVPTGW